MRRMILSAACILLAPLAAMAQQDFPKAEVFGGYSYFRANPEGFNLNGWNASITGNLTEWFGIEGDFSGHYGRPTDYGVPIEGVTINSHTFLAGPKVSLRSGNTVPFAHFLIGVNRAGTNDYGLSTSNRALAAVIGGGIDIGLSRHIAVRPFQLDYLMTHYDVTGDGCHERQNNFRYSAGIVFKFGE